MLLPFLLIWCVIYTAESQQEVLSMSYRKKVEFWLQVLRVPAGAICYEDALFHIRSTLASSGLTLSDVGTTEKELEKGRIQGCKANALYWLEYARSGTIMYKTALSLVCTYLSKGGLSPEDIGSSQAELDFLLATPPVIPQRKPPGLSKTTALKHSFTPS
jgi:hypothetical protein